MKKQSLIIFVKNLQAGKVKTRLAATIGDEMALLIYKNLLNYTASIAQNLPFQKTIYYSAFIELSDCFDNKFFKKEIQYGNDLGERMKNAFENSFTKGSQEIVLIGSDCIELTTDLILNAFSELKNYDVVIGPANDGGYYLIGLKKLSAALFQNISWSTNAVLAQTLAICATNNLKVFLLSELSDIDDENDLKDAYKVILQAK